MSLQLPPYQPIPEPDESTEMFEVAIANLHPTQWCIGLAEVWARRGADAETVPLARFLSKQLAALKAASKEEGRC